MRQQEKRRREKSGQDTTSMADLHSEAGGQGDIVSLLHDLKVGQDSLRKTIESKVDKLRNEITTTLEIKLKEIKDEVSLELASMDNKLSILEGRLTLLENVGSMAKPGKDPDHVYESDVSIIAFGIVEEIGENLLEKVQAMICALEGDIAVKIVKCVRLRSRRDGVPGLVKVAFESNAQKGSRASSKTKSKK